MGKTRVTPGKFVSIPRLELAAAVLLAKCGMFIKKELQLECTHETFWTDSKVVLGYIQNNTKRFKIFVTNRIHQIHESCRVEQCRYVSSELNPADHASRRLETERPHGFMVQNFYGKRKTLDQRRTVMTYVKKTLK